MQEFIIRLASQDHKPQSTHKSQATNDIHYTNSVNANEFELSFLALQDFRSTSQDSEEFSKALLDSGVRSEPLSDKLCDVVEPKR